MALNLTEGAIERIYRDDISCVEEFKPVLQVFDVKLFRLLLSDGKHFNVGVLNIGLQELVLHRMLRKGSIVRLTDFSFNVVTNPKIFFISDLEILLNKCDIMGDPESSSLIRFTNLGLSDGKQDSIMEVDLNLTQGAIERMSSNNFSCDEEEFEPVLQVIQMESSFLWLSDGSHCTVAMLSHEYLPDSQRLQKGSFVKLTNFKMETYTHTKIIFISDFKILLDKYDLIGEPVPLLKVRRDIIEGENLTQGAIERMYNYNFSCDEKEFKPVLQVIHMESSSLWLSDGTHSTIALISPDLEEEFGHTANHSVEHQLATFRRSLHNGSFVKLTNFKLGTLTHIQIILIFDLEILLDKCDLVGEPVPLLKARQDRIMGVSLTQAAIASMYCNKFTFDKEFKPVLQVIHVNIPYLLLSDSLFYNIVILPRNLVKLVHSGRLQKGSVVNLTHFTASLIQNRKVIVIFHLDVMLDKCELIGEPVPLPKNAPDRVVILDKGELIGEPYSTTTSKCTFKTIC